MRKSHIYLFGVAIVTLGFVASAPGAADGQDPQAEAETAEVEATEPPAQTEPAEPAAPHEGAEEWVEFSSWPVERQAEYQLWPLETQTYYWTLSRERQAVFWQLSDEDKVALTAMTGPERDRAWERLEERAQTSPGP